jgi:hypothetical protein
VGQSKCKLDFYRVYHLVDYTLVHDQETSYSHILTMHSVNKSYLLVLSTCVSARAYYCMCLHFEALTSRHSVATIFSQVNISSSSSVSTSLPANETIPNPGRRSLTTIVPRSSLDTTRERNNSVSGVRVAGLMPSSYATQGVALQWKQRYDVPATRQRSRWEVQSCFPTLARSPMPSRAQRNPDSRLLLCPPQVSRHSRV